MKWRHQFQRHFELAGDHHQPPGKFWKVYDVDVQGCCVVFAVQMTVMIEGDVMTIVWMAMMTVWYAAELAGRKPLSRVSGKKACQANPCVHTLLYSITSQTSILPTPTHSPIVCTILPYNYITRPNICLPSRAIHANTAILSGYCLYPCIWSHKSKFYWWTIG